MKLEPTSYYVNNVVHLKDSVKEFLRLKNPEECDLSRKPPKCRTLQGGVLSDIRYSWLCRGPKLEILHTKSGAKVAAWSFGNVLHDFDTYITCVTELPSAQGKLPLLIVGLECEIGGGMICMFDINSSRVVRAIQIDDRVTTIHVVNPGCDTSFPGALRAMDGVLAIGTSRGKIILIDLCRQICEEAVGNFGPDYVRDELNACRLSYLTHFDLNNLEIHKERSLNSGNHLALQINESSTSGVHFALHGPNGEVRLHANMEEVAISALHYSSQLGSLLVGFNFGAFQLYNLLNIRLEYTSPVYEDCIPITHFAIQEPCDDPRAFCYVWVVYNILENGDNGFPMAVMYALAYDTKDFLEGYGYLYQEFNSCSVRFQIELGAVPGFHLSKNGCTGARCISLNAYTKSVVNRQAGVQDVPDDKIALCSIVWIAWNQNLTSTETYLTLFDLNQWYKEQMPSTTRLEADALSYMSCESLSELFGLSDVNSNLLDVRLDRNSLCPFVCAQRLEEHYYPTALAFRAICVLDANIIWLGNYGVQRHLLTQLEQAGPLRLLRPTDLFHRCISLGLTPLYTDILYSVKTAVNLQREMILNVALEHQLVRWLCTCARDWSNGSQSMAGCTLDMLLNWAWRRANTLKFQSDKLCIPLFDHQGMKLDSNALLQLNHCTCQLKHLTTLFETVVVKCNRFLNEQDVEDIKYQWKALEMISVYLEVLQWLLNVGLLPECPLSMYPLPDELEKISAPYPVESLVRFYSARRADLKSQTMGLIEGLNNRNLLFIDNLIDIECNGDIVHKQWECDGGNGLYPPPSLQAVLRAYLIEDIDIVHKHCLLIYLFLDLAMTLDQSQYKAIITHLIKFPAVFKLSPSVIKITQAFWQLDHGDFSTAMTQLLDPSVNNEDLKPWHHRIVLKALLLQGQHQHALLYQQVRKPPVSSVQDICIIITLLIVNDLLQEAFHYQRYNRSNFNEKEILKHFFTVCERMNQQASILHLPLCPIEEKEFIDYLKCHPNENNKNFLVIYYLQRDRYGEAFQINDLLNNDEILKQGLIGQQEKNFRNAIVSGFKKTLPEVTQQLLDYCKREKDKNSINVKGPKNSTPIPMSVYVHDNKTQTKYKSTLIQASFQKAKELWTIENNDLNNTPFISTPKVFRFSAERKDSSIIYPAILDSSNMNCTTDIDVDVDVDESVTPAKRIKLSPRRSINENQRLDEFKRRLSCNGNNSLLSTPIVKRRSIRNTDQLNDTSVVGTPPSILKVRSLLRNSISPENNNKIRETSVTPELLEEPHVETIPTTTTTTTTTTQEIKQKKRTSFGISPRKPIPRTPRPAVRFEEHSNTRSNSRSSNESTQSDHHSHQIQIDVHREQTPEKSDSKNSSRSTDDVFYSPNSSMNFSSESSSINESINKSGRPLKRKANESSSISSRRSYKPPTSLINIQNTSVRESLKKTEQPKETNIKIIITEAPAPAPAPEPTPTPNTRLKSRQSLSAKTPETTPEQQQQQQQESPKIVAKVSGRRSLSRQVLENNLFAASERMSTRLSLAKLTDADKKRGVEVSYSKSTTSIVKTVMDDKVEEKCAVKMIQKKDEFSSERNEDNSALVIKHVHNEIETKSNVTKVTEFLDQDQDHDQDQDQVEIPEISEKSNRFEEMNVLSFNSDISESEASHFYKDSPKHTERRYSVLLSTPDSEKGTMRSDQNLEHEEMQEMFEEEEKISDHDNEQIETDKMEEEGVVTSSHDDAVEEMKQTHSDNETPIQVDDESSDEEKISNQDENELKPAESSSEEESEEEIKQQTIAEEEPQSTTSSSSSNEDSSQSSSDVILIKSSPDNSNSSEDKTQQILQENNEEEYNVDEEDDVAQSENTEEQEQLSEEINDYDENDDADDNNTSEENFQLNLDESLDDEQIERDDEEEPEGKSNQDAVMEDINEDNTDENNEFFINEDIEEMENVEFITDSETAKQTQELIAEEKEETTIEHDEAAASSTSSSSCAPHTVETNQTKIIEINETTIQETPNETEELEETVNPLEHNVIEISETTIQESKENEESTMLQTEETQVTVNPLEENIIKINETTVQDSNENEIEEIEVTVNPLEQNIIEISETTIQETPNEPKEMEVTVNPLEQNIIEISDATIQESKENETEEIEVTVNPLEQNIIETETETTIMETSPNPLEKNVIEETSETIINPPEETTASTPARRTRSASQNSETKAPKTPTRSSTRRRSIDQKIAEEAPKEKPAQRITRKRSSVTVDDEPKPPEEPTIQTRTSRKSLEHTPRKTRASSVINLEVIEEDKPMSRTRRAASVDPKTETVNPRQRRGQSLEPETTVKRGRKRTLQSDNQDLQSISEKIEEYSATHRLTRHQKTIMEKSLVVQQKSRLDKLEEEVEHIDPIKLLDKESFTGSPDKEEGTYRAVSPASSVSTQSSAAIVDHASPSTPKRKRGRPSLSGTPGSSTTTGMSAEKKSPGRPRRRSFTQAQQAMVSSTPPTRARRSSRTVSHDQDDAASVVSVSSVASVPVVQLKQLEEADFVRHRSLSPTALKEETQKNRRRSTRSTNLTKINEEANVEKNEEKPRRGRRKTETEGTESELTGTKKPPRRSSYKPLENYLPDIAVVKTRKTFKIRKFSRDTPPP